jgi:AhpC/TSA family
MSTVATQAIIRIGDPAPDFEAETTQGPIRLHEWMGDSWALLFSHPKDFTPIRTTELSYMARIKAEFERRNVKVIGLSVDRVEDHENWAGDIEAGPATSRRPRATPRTTRSSATPTTASRSCTGCCPRAPRARRSVMPT